MARKAGKPYAKLQGEAKSRAYGAMLELLSSMFDAEQVTEDLQEYAKEKYGLVADTYSWSLSHCQGDGVAFYGTVQLDGLAEKHPDLDAVLVGFHLAFPDTSIWASAGDGSGGRYHHWNSMNPSVEHDFRDRDDPSREEHADETANWIQDWLESTLQEISRDVERYGYEIVDDQTSEEYVADFCEGNEYRFDSEGNLLD